MVGVATVVLHGHDFPPGTTVEAYIREALTANGSRPSGTAVDASVVQPDGSLTFDGLEQGRRYVAWAQSRPWSFYAPEGSLDLMRPIKGSEAQELRNFKRQIGEGLAGGLLRISESGADPLPWLDVNLTTPERAIGVFSRLSDADGGADIDYGWVAIAAARELGNRPVSGFASRTEAQKSYGGSSVSRGYGKDQEAHAHELTVGLFPSRATVVADGTNVLRSIVPTDPSSQFFDGMAIRGDGAFPGSTTITSITGRRGSPNTITVSNSVPAGTYAVRARDLVGVRESIGMLVTFNGGDSGDADWPGNPNGIGLHFQSYNAYSKPSNALQFGPSAVEPATGRVQRFASTLADRALSVESVVMNNFAVFSAGVYSGSVLSFSGVTAASGLNFATSGAYSIAALVLSGQNIATDQTVGMKLWTNPLEKGGFFGRTPQVRPTLGVPVATDAASTQALANALRAALIETGTGLGLVAA